MSFARYSREVTLDDLNNVHTFAVLAVAPGSRVLDLGAADGSVARVLADRGCLVTAVERDAAAVDVMVAHGLPVVHGDLEALAPDHFAEGAFDVVLLLDVLEHLVDPGAVLARTPAWLAPGGRVLLSVPNVAHAAVRLALLQGRFPRTDVGLLDRTHLHFYDVDSLRELVAAAGLEILDLLTVERDVHETEIDVDPSALPPEALAAATADASARVYQYFVVARAATAVEASRGGLSQALQTRLRETEGSYRALESYAASLDAEVLRLRERLEASDATGPGGAALATSGEQGTAPRAGAQAMASGDGAAADLESHLADMTADRDTAQRQLRERMGEMQDLAATVRVLQQDVAVQREFAASLAGQLPRIAARGGDAQVIGTLERFEAVAPTPEAAAALAAEAQAYRQLQGALAIRALARMDALLRRLPRVRAGLRAIGRRFAPLR